MRQDYIWLITRCDDARGVRQAALLSFLLHCVFIGVMATTAIFFPLQGHYAKPEVIWFSSALLPDTTPSAPSPDSVPLTEHPAVAGPDTDQRPPEAVSDVPVTEPEANTVPATPLQAQEVREATGNVAPLPESEPEPEMQVAVKIAAVQSLEKEPTHQKPNLTEHLPIPVQPGMHTEEITAPARALPSGALSKVSLAAPSKQLSEQVPVREIYPVAPTVLIANTKETASEPIRIERRSESGRSLSATTPVPIPKAEAATLVTSTQVPTSISTSIAEPARKAPATAQREVGRAASETGVTTREASSSGATSHLRQPVSQQVKRQTIVHSASASIVSPPAQPPAKSDTVIAPTPAPQSVSTQNPISPRAQPEQSPAQLKPARDETQLDKQPTKTAGPGGLFAPPLSGDLKLEISGEAESLNRVKTVVIFRAYPKSRHTEPMKKADFRKPVAVTPERIRTSANAVQEVIEVAREGIYDFRNVTEGGEADVTFTLKIHENSGRAKTRQAGTRKTGEQGTIVKVLMPEGLVWDDKKAFTGSFEDATSITKFNTETGIVWKEYRE